MAANAGIQVVAKARKWAPYAKKTRKEKVLPRMNSPKPPSTSSMPPKKRVTVVDGVPKAPLPRHATVTNQYVLTYCGRAR